LASGADPKTPLGKWMKPNVGVPFASEDYPTVQQSLTTVANKPPPSGDYGQWAAIANAGAAAAGQQDRKGTKASCNKCHDLYKQKYISDFPNQPFP
jgi:cytochrome c553